VTRVVLKDNDRLNRDLGAGYAGLQLNAHFLHVVVYAASIREAKRSDADQGLSDSIVKLERRFSAV
jgi:hypothetical protein